MSLEITDLPSDNVTPMLFKSGTSNSTATFGNFYPSELAPSREFPSASSTYHPPPHSPRGSRPRISQTRSPTSKSSAPPSPPPRPPAAPALASLSPARTPRTGTPRSTTCPAGWPPLARWRGAARSAPG
eukprot:CAMPEP_0184725532 /NCGR_PEP_ID=MMETSP0314-20130426/31186_1 /TAXON_ID=38298 /ORGANISM="Rhodella maculata, Strain CCMP 736" /LENGTH=128 /DNA_ID=CAMNT_0027190785 /DNA_START=59 /DNA_END=441 /DNA_ORIENTATION=+